MALVKTVSYVFNVNGDRTGPMQACRGIRQWETLSPLIFVIMMECLHRLLQGLNKEVDFNHHSK